jgi:hypothetical protein
MNSTLLCVALLVPGYGEEDVLEQIEKNKGLIYHPADGEKYILFELSWETSDSDLTELCELRRLGGLMLSGFLISDRGLRTVASMKWMWFLELSRMNITDEGLQHLESMKNLKCLKLKNCPNITDAGVARLQKALPNCKIER